METETPTGFAMPGMDEDQAAAQAGERWDDRDTDQKGTEKTIKDSMLTAGTYKTEELSVTLGEYDDGRRVAKVFAKVIGTGKNNAGEEGTVRFTMSPDRVDKQDEEGTPDHKSKLWAQAERAAGQVLEEYPKKQGQVVKYLESYPVSLTVFQGTDSVVVNGIKPYKE